MEAIKQRMEATKLRASKLQELLVSRFQERFYPQYQVHYASPQKYIFSFSHNNVLKILYMFVLNIAITSQFLYYGELQSNTANAT